MNPGGLLMQAYHNANLGRGQQPVDVSLRTSMGKTIAAHWRFNIRERMPRQSD